MPTPRNTSLPLTRLRPSGHPRAQASATAERCRNGRDILDNRTAGILTVAGLYFWTCAAAVKAQVQIHGSLAPEGPPVGEVVRIDAGDACIIDLAQRYSIDGGLSGELKIDYRIFVAGPCGAAPGAFEETWIARGTFEGEVSERSASATLWYRAEVAEGGVVDGTMRLAGEVRANLSVSGRCSDGLLTYQGTLEPSEAPWRMTIRVPLLLGGRQSHRRRVRV